nr:hypothetical protein Iba_scaffold23887CG0020 [Ipomoea batatas]
MRKYCSCLNTTLLTSHNSPLNALSSSFNTSSSSNDPKALKSFHSNAVLNKVIFLSLRGNFSARGKLRSLLLWRASFMSFRFSRRSGVLSKMSPMQLEGDMVESVLISVLTEALFLLDFGGGGSTMELLLWTCLSLDMLHISALTSRLFWEELNTRVSIFQRLLKGFAVMSFRNSTSITLRRGKDFGMAARHSLGISTPLEQ